MCMYIVLVCAYDQDSPFVNKSCSQGNILDIQHDFRTYNVSYDMRMHTVHSNRVGVNGTVPPKGTMLPASVLGIDYDISTAMW